MDDVDAYAAGRLAFRMGNPKNPYPLDSADHAAWEQGWQDEANEREE